MVIDYHSKTIQEGHLKRLPIFPQSLNKRFRHRQFLFLIGRFLELFSSETALPNNRNLVGSIYERSSIKIAHLAVSRVEDFLEIDQSETRIACGVHVC
jgi:hypothetical protein